MKEKPKRTTNNPTSTTSASSRSTAAVSHQPENDEPSQRPPRAPSGEVSSVFSPAPLRQSYSLTLRNKPRLPCSQLCPQERGTVTPLSSAAPRRFISQWQVTPLYSETHNKREHKIYNSFQSPPCSSPGSSSSYTDCFLWTSTLQENGDDQQDYGPSHSLLFKKKIIAYGEICIVFSHQKKIRQVIILVTDKSTEIIHCQPSQNVTQKTELYRGNLNKFTSPWRPINNNKQCLAILQLSGCVIHGVLLPQHPPALRQVVPLWSVIESTKVEGSGGWEE